MFKSKTAGMLIERGVPYETRKLHRKRYFAALLEDYDGLIEDRKPLLAFHRTQIERLEQMDGVIVQQLIADPMLKERVQRLKSIEGVGDITALTWAVEVGELSRFPNERHAISYCGLCAAERKSAGVTHRGPLSKQRNHFLQITLIEASHLAVRFNDQLRSLYEAECRRGQPTGPPLLWLAGWCGGSWPLIENTSLRCTVLPLDAGRFLGMADLSGEQDFSAGEAETGSGGDQPAKE